MNNKIFVIDDDANILFALQSQLSEKGFKVEASLLNKELERILKKIEEHSPSLVVLDICHERFNCLELISKIKLSDFLKKTHVMVYTINTTKNKEKVANLGVEYFFSKDNITIDELINKIYKIYNNIIKK